MAAIGINDNFIRLRKATLQDADLLLEWRNDPQTRLASHHTAVVEREQHLSWLKATLDDPSRQLWIAEEKGVPVGTVRADWTDDSYQLSWTVAPSARGRGVAKQMVARLAGQISQPIRAQVKQENIASVRVAESAGMEFEREADGVLHYQRLNPNLDRKTFHLTNCDSSIVSQDG